MTFIKHTDAMHWDTAEDWTPVPKITDESLNTSTTFQNDDELSFTTDSGAVYVFEGLLIVASPAGGGTPDFKMLITDTAAQAASISVVAQGMSTGNAAISQAGLGGTSLPFGTNTFQIPVSFRGHVVGAGGTLYVQWAQNTSNANNVTVYAGSFIRYRRIV